MRSKLFAGLSILVVVACSGPQQRQDQNTAATQTKQLRQQTADKILEARVSTAVVSDAGTNAFRVAPHARDGIVTLTGSVSSSSIEQTIVQTVTAVPGVRKVISQITVGKS